MTPLDGRLCEPLDWDSDFFGFPIARVRRSALDEATAESIDEWCERRGVRCLYLLADADDERTARVARATGYRPVAVRVTLHHDLDPTPDGRPDIPVREARPVDVPALRALAARSHQHTRFYHDPGFDRARCDELYAAWIEAGIRDSKRWVLAADADEGPVGYQLVAPAGRGGTAQMVLLAVDAGHRGTQERNDRSLRVHLALGFSAVRREVWHHKWFRR